MKTVLVIFVVVIAAVVMLASRSTMAKAAHRTHETNSIINSID